jgi:hypothetical protein
MKYFATYIYVYVFLGGSDADVSSDLDSMNSTEVKHLASSLLNLNRELQSKLTFLEREIVQIKETQNFPAVVTEEGMLVASCYRMFT